MIFDGKHSDDEAADEKESYGNGQRGKESYWYGQVIRSQMRV